MKDKFRNLASQVVNQHASSLHPDAYGLVKLVDQMLIDRPDLFDGEEITQQLRTVLYSREGIGQPPLGSKSKFLSMVDRVNEKAFGNFSVAFVGINYAHAAEGFTNIGTIIMRMQGNLHFPDDHPRSALTIEKTEQIAREGRHVDYVLTGNVLSDPHVEQDRIFAACALILKNGGKAIHMLNLGGHNELAVSDNARLMKLCGAEIVYRGDLAGNENGSREILIVRQAAKPAIRTDAAFDHAAKYWERHRDFITRDERKEAHDKALRDLLAERRKGNPFKP